MIDATDLTKRFDTFTALDHINLQIETGSIFGLVGSNGSGKSTLLRLLSGVYLADGGQLTVDRSPVGDHPALKAKIFYLSDTPWFIHQSNLLEMAKFYAMMYTTFCWETYEKMLQVFPISPLGKISTMSKGMQRQAALILALACQPSYLLLDEAFDGLDPVMRAALKQVLINGISQWNMTVIIASHNLRELEDLCDHVGLLHNGKVIFNSELDQLKETLQKVQVVFPQPVEAQVFDNLKVLKATQSGSMWQLVIRGEQQEILNTLSALQPVYLEAISPTLEEIFVYELEAIGYDVHNILG